MKLTPLNFTSLEEGFAGEFFTDEAMRRIYATDASAYREVPVAVAIPKTIKDVKRLIHFAQENNISLIPRAAGTSLAGQVVGSGVIVDVSKYFGEVQEINGEEGYVWVQPGVVRDELNRMLSPYKFFFAPETSTSNRAMIGGMIGNNSCGANSVVYGSTREHLLELKVLLSDGSEAHIKPTHTLRHKNPLLNGAYRKLESILSNPLHLERVKEEFPKVSVSRRNTGYALDILAGMKPFRQDGQAFNFCSLIAGSEGTLAFIIAAKLKLTKMPPVHKRLVCVHCKSVDESLRANLIALKFQPSACELMDHYILEATKRNKEQNENRIFVQGDPLAILMVELTRNTEREVDKAAHKLVANLTKEKLGYAFPMVKQDDISRVWALRKAGLGLLSNMVGDEKPVPVIEDTAVDVVDLPAYIREFNLLLARHGIHSVHYAHAGSGELHLRPIVDLKTKKGRQLFRTIAEEVAFLVKKYRGSLSGEHGDGRLRGEFIPQMIGAENYDLLKQIKNSWDPNGIFNPGKIVNTAPMDTSLRYEENQKTPAFNTLLDFSEDQGIVRATERCNGSGDCRKSEWAGGTMCPSYMATHDEKDATRARANILREFLSRSDDAHPFAHKEIGEVMALCLSCKGCKRECPSNVDMAKLKAEWQYQSYQAKGVPWRVNMIANYSKSMEAMASFPWFYNLVRNGVKPLLGFSSKRSIPKMAPQPLKTWFCKHFRHQPGIPKKHVYFFFDEFTNYLDVEIGKKAITLLDRLGYGVLEVPHQASGRAYISVGMLEEAKRLAEENVSLFSPLASRHRPLIGIEPSAILTFRDEYPSLLRGTLQKQAKKLASQVFTIDEFLSAELDAGNLLDTDFTKDKKRMLIHGHCHQKAVASLTPMKKLLTTPKNYEVKMIPSGCCGMAGAFGYEKGHYDISMKIGELVLFPKVREADKNTIIVAAGTSCRHQILDGTGKRAYHPVEVL